MEASDQGTHAYVALVEHLARAPQTATVVVRNVASREHHHWRLSATWEPAQLRKEVEAVHRRHGEVEQDHVGAPLPGPQETCAPVHDFGASSIERRLARADRLPPKPDASHLVGLHFIPNGGRA